MTQGATKTETNPLNPMIHLVLIQPKMAANIAAVVRLGTGMNAAVHVCGPLVFEKSDKTRWRAALDYWAGARVHFHESLDNCLSLLNGEPWLVEVGGEKTLWDASFQRGDIVLFGPEDGHIPESFIDKAPERVLSLPQPGPVRSLNLAQCVAVTTFEAYRQIIFETNDA